MSSSSSLLLLIFLHHSRSYLDLLGTFGKLVGLQKSALVNARNRTKTGLDKVQSLLCLFGLIVVIYLFIYLLVVVVVCLFVCFLLVLPNNQYGLHLWWLQT